MADNKIKVTSLSKSRVCINLKRLNGKEIPVAPKGFAYLTEDELAYLVNTSKIFKRGSLKIDGENPAEIVIPNSPNALTDDDLSALLKKPQKQFETSLSEIDNISVVRRILEMAKEQDKSVKAVDMIQARIDELME